MESGRARVGIAARRAGVALAAALLLALPMIDAEASSYRRIRVLNVVYPWSFTASAGPAEVARVRAEVDQAVEFFWRASRMRLHLDVHHDTVEWFLPEPRFAQVRPGSYWLGFWREDERAGIQDDLRERGHPEGVYDVVVVFYAWKNAPGHQSTHGGATFGVKKQVLGKGAYIGIPMAWDPDKYDQILVHEMLHALESIFRENGYRDFPVIHNGDFFGMAAGEGASWPHWILDSIPDAAYFAPGIWGSVERFPDADDDGLPDDSPPEVRFPLTEASLGSSRRHADSDGDGIGDRDEAAAGSDPTRVDPPEAAKASGAPGPAGAAP